jgi:hypothetical protein
MWRVLPIGDHTMPGRSRRVLPFEISHFHATTWAHPSYRPLLRFGSFLRFYSHLPSPSLCFCHRGGFYPSHSSGAFPPDSRFPATILLIRHLLHFHCKEEVTTLVCPLLPFNEEGFVPPRLSLFAVLLFNGEVSCSHFVRVRDRLFPWIPKAVSVSVYPHRLRGYLLSYTPQIDIDV